MSAERLNLPVCVFGDFNAKIGSQRGHLGQVEEFFDLLPEDSEKEEFCDGGIDLLSTFSSLEYFRLQFAIGGHECLTFRVRPGADGRPREGGSTIDYVFISHELVDVVRDVGVHIEPESSHVLLFWSFSTQTPGVEVAPDESARGGTVLTFNFEALLDLTLPDSMLDVLGNSDLDAHTAYAALLEFISLYTKRTCTRMGSTKQGESREQQELRRVMRKVERMRCREQDPARREFLGREYTRLANLWREKRDLDRRQAAERLRTQFWSAHCSGNSYLAWKHARTNLSGKGGGIKTSATKAITREGWEAHFSRLFGGANAADLSRDLQDVALSGVTVPLLDSPFEACEVTQVLERKKNHRAPGPDGLRIEFLRIFRYDDRVCQALANIFTIIARERWVPPDWERAYLYVLYKGCGDVASVNSFRGIALKSHILKLFEALVCARLTKWLDSTNQLPPEQLAYRRGMSGTDHIYFLHVIRESEVLRSGEFFAGFIDIHKAFPSVSRKLLLESLVQAGVSDKTVALLRHLYSVDSFQLLLDGTPGTVVFTVVIGVHEGSCLSPTLFIFFVRDLPAVIRQVNGTDAPVVNGIARPIMFYADDVTELAKSTPGLQVATNATVHFFRDRELVTNPDKCDFVHFVRPRSTPRSFSITVDGVSRDSVQVVRYLGVMFDSKSAWKEQKAVALSRSRIALGRLKVITLTVGRGHVKLLVNLFDSIVGSVYRYGLGVPGWCHENVR
jgi:hypothetical protein